MKKVPLLRALVVLASLVITSCGSSTSKSKPEESSFASSSSSISSSEESSSSFVSSSEQSSSSSLEVSSSSSISSSSTTSSSSVSSSSSVKSSSQVSSSSSSSSSSVVSSSSSLSSISSSSSNSELSSSSQVSSSSSSSQASSSNSVSSSASSSSSTSSSSSSSSSQNVDPLRDYEPIPTFSLRMPGEFEPCSMVKMCYPNNMPISAYREIAKDNKVLLLVNPDYSGNSRISQAQSDLAMGNVNLDNVTFLDMPIDDDYAYWVRDFSPFYVFNNQDLSIVDFTYNRPQRTEQNAVPKKLSEYFNIGYTKMGITHTGGNLMQDGRGTAFSDDLVIQENNNNKTRVLSRMKSFTGTDNYVITIDPQGDYIAHIDCWGKIVAPDKIIVAKLPESNPRYQYYEQVADQLANTKCAYGYNYRIYRIEEPGGSVVAPYTNSLIANGHVYMPLGSNSTYNQKALEVYKEALPGYEVIGIQGFASSNQNAFLNTDALHCRTHEVPDQNMVFIDSREVYRGEVALKDYYVIKTNVVSYAKEELSNVSIHYSINNGNYVTSEMSKYLDTTNYTFTFQGLKSGDDVKYYIDATDTKNNYNVDPSCGQLDPHHFVIA